LYALLVRYAYLQDAYSEVLLYILVRGPCEPKGGLLEGYITKEGFVWVTYKFYMLIKVKNSGPGGVY